MGSRTGAGSVGSRTGAGSVGSRNGAGSGADSVSSRNGAGSGEDSVGSRTGIQSITSATKYCFVSNLPDLSQFLSTSNSAEKLDLTESMDSLFSSTLDTVAPLRLRKIKENSPTPWYNSHPKESSTENGGQQEENKTRGIWYCLAGKYHILQKSIKNC